MCTRFIWEVDNSAGSYGTGTENHGKEDISTRIVWVGMGNQDFHVNDLDGNEISRFIRELVGWDHGNDICEETGNNHSSREILREFSCGIFPEDCPAKFHGLLQPLKTKKGADIGCLTNLFEAKCLNQPVV